jgi:hypothetical protein
MNSRVTATPISLVFNTITKVHEVSQMEVSLLQTKEVTNFISIDLSLLKSIHKVKEHRIQILYAKTEKIPIVIGALGLSLKKYNHLFTHRKVIQYHFFFVKVKIFHCNFNLYTCHFNIKKCHFKVIHYNLSL